jgi:drug/metabolite transporter (DMT)-like permease
LLAIAGVVLCSLKDIMQTDFSVQYLIGNLLIFLRCSCSGFYNTICKKIAEGYTEMEMLFYTYIFMVILLAPLVWHYEGDVFKNIPSFTGNTWTGLILLTVFHNFLSMILFFYSTEKSRSYSGGTLQFPDRFFRAPDCCTSAA